ncbi:MAG: DUF2299 family protein [Nitrososphaeraceae archaeon]
MAEENSLIERIQNWLTEEGLQNNKLEDKDVDANIAFWPNPLLKMHLLIKKDRITIVLSMLFRKESLDIVLSNPGRRNEFFKNLNLTLYQQVCEASQQFDKKTGALTGLRVEKRMWQESLTKTSFFDAMLTVIHFGFIFGIKEQELIDSITNN